MCKNIWQILVNGAPHYEGTQNEMESTFTQITIRDYKEFPECDIKLVEIHGFITTKK